jgi:hypothetical protein
MWANQTLDLIRGIGMLTLSEADELRHGRAERKPSALDALSDIRYPPTNQTLLEILDERSQNGRLYQITPNFGLAAWLSRNCLATV